MPPTPPPGVSQFQDDAQNNQPPVSTAGKDECKKDREPRRVGPEDEDRRLRKGEKRPFGQVP